MKETKFKQTEIGMIPDDWEMKDIFKNCTIKARIGWQGLKSAEYLKIGDYLLITGTDFCNGFINWKSCNYVTEWRFKQDRNIQIQDGDVLITKDGTIGKVAFIPKIPLNGTLNSGVFVVRPKDKSLIDVVFLSLIFKSFWFGNFLEQITSGSTIVHLYQKDFIKFNFPLPPTLAEQQKIAKALSDVDNVISTLEKLITKKKTLKQGTMQQLLTGKKRLPGFAKSDKFKQTEIGEIPEDWEVKSLNSIGEVKMCKRVLKSQTSETGEIPFYKIGTFGKEPDAYISKELFSFLKSNYSYPKKGDILISAAGTIGRTVVFDGKDSFFQDSNIVWLDNDESIISNFFLSYIFKVIKWKTEDGGIVSRLYNNNFRVTQIQIPSKPEQIAIANVLSSMDKEIEALNTKLEKYRNLKTGMMQQLLTGKIRLG